MVNRMTVDEYRVTDGLGKLASRFLEALNHCEIMTEPKIGHVVFENPQQ